MELGVEAPGGEIVKEGGELAADGGGELAGALNFCEEGADVVLVGGEVAKGVEKGVEVVVGGRETRTRGGGGGFLAGLCGGRHGGAPTYWMHLGLCKSYLTPGGMF